VPSNRRLILATCSLLQFLVIGAQYTFAVLYLRIVEEFGAPRAVVSGIQSVVFLVEMAAFIAAGLLVDRYRPRRMITLGLVLMALGLGLSAAARTLWHLYVSLGVIATVGAPLIKIGVVVVLTEAFPPARRGLVFGLAYAANGLAEAFFFPVVDVLAESAGWRAAYGAVAAALFLVGLPAVWRTLKSAAAVPTSAAEAGTRAGLSLAIVFFALSSILIGLNTEAAYQHLIPHVVTVGYPLRIGVWMLTVASLGHALGMAAGGWLSDHVGRVRALVVSSIAPALAAAGVLFTDDRGLLFGAAFAWGAGTGGMISVRSATWGDVFQGRRQGFITGLLLPTYNLGGAAIAWYGGYAFDRAGTYQSPFTLAVLAAVLAPLLFAMALGRTTPSSPASVDRVALDPRLR